jgi:hypothetical protein
MGGWRDAGGIERFDVPRVLEHGTELFGELLQFLIAQVKPGQPGDVGDVGGRDACRHGAMVRGPVLRTGRLFALRRTSSYTELHVAVIRAERLLPPLVGRRGPGGIGVDAVDRADRGQALAAPGAELGQDDHIDPVIEDRPELRRTVPKAGIAVDAL